MEYVLVLPVPFYRVSANEFACESAFSDHLRLLCHNIPVQYDSIRVCGPSIPADDYQRSKEHLGHIREQQEQIFLTELYPKDIRFAKFLKSYALSTFKTLWQVVSRAGLVHSGPSMNLFQPIEIFSLVAAKLLGKKSIAVVDIDIRKDVERAYQLGMINKNRYLIERIILEPLRRLQLRWVARNCSLVLFKGQALVSDYGNEKDSVKNFFDASHSSQHIISEAQLAEKINRKNHQDQPIKCVYFGRFVARKGIDYCIRSVVQARKNHNANINLTIIGDGPDKEKLASLIKEQDAEQFIVLLPPIQFGPELFSTLYRFDILLAAPLTEDTPRSAFDAMAAGMALCAYDTDYYHTLAQFGPMVKVSPWLNVAAMAETIANLAKDPTTLAKAQIDARRFAEENTQEIWLEKRLKWTKEYCSTA
jgi:glycosyltransferase involved in cell wall biosynthesis